jgi:ATP-dependent Zn protease
MVVPASPSSNPYEQPHHYASTGRKSASGVALATPRSKQRSTKATAGWVEKNV